MNARPDLTALFSLLAISVVALAIPAVAQLVVSTEDDTYTVGDTIEITIHNGGPSEATFYSVPYYAIINVDSGVVVFGETGVPVIEIMPPGTTEAYTHDTTAYPDPAGTYVITLSASCDDPGSILETTYVLEGPVPAGSRTLSAVKALFD
jgi:hypothetical protein